MSESSDMHHVISSWQSVKHTLCKFTRDLAVRAEAFARPAVILAEIAASKATHFVRQAAKDAFDYVGAVVSPLGTGEPSPPPAPASSKRPGMQLAFR